MIRIDRRSFLAGAAGSLALPAVASAGASARPDLPAIAGSIAAEAQRELKLKGLAIGVLAPGGEHVAGAGDTGRGAVPDGSTVFGIGSITKTFTTLTLARAVDQGVVAYDDPVVRHLPDGFDVPTGGGREITLEHLATQTSGLPRLPAGMEKLPGFDPRDPYAALTVERLARLLRRTRLLSAPGQRFHYSNFGEGLLGIALAHRRGLGYERTVREAVTRPLGLRDVVIERDADQAARAAVGHDPKGNPTPDWRLPALAGAGALYGTGNDLLTYLRAHLRLRPERMGAALRTVRTPRARVDARTRIGLAWFTSRLPGVGSFAWHNGITSGFTSFAAYVPGAGLGVVALSNSGTPVDGAGIATLRALAEAS